MNEEENGPMIVASGGDMGQIFEMIPFNIKFTGENVTRVINITIDKYKENKGVVVDVNKATIIGQYEDSFIFNNNLFYMHEGKHKQARKFEDVEIEDADIYLWIPPKAPVIFDYVITMEYEAEGDEGVTVRGVITQTLTHIVMSNYTYFAKQVRKLIDIRREAYRGRNGI